VLKVSILHFVAHLLYTLSRISSSIELFGGQASCAVRGRVECLCFALRQAGLSCQQRVLRPLFYQSLSLAVPI
jgi:hypothetical protein